MSQRQTQRKATTEGMGLHEVTIGSKVCGIGKFSAIEGWKLIHRLTKAAGPMIGAFSAGDFSKGISDLFREINEDDLVRLIKQLTSVCLVDGKKVNDNDLVEYAFVLELCGEVIKYNFGDFFSQVVDATQSVIGQRQADQT
jgi:hypothetical protein